jgi:hypothetical protein
MSKFWLFVFLLTWAHAAFASENSADVMIYYKQGDSIIIKNCGNNYPAIEKVSDCKSKCEAKKVSIDDFKKGLFSQLEVTVPEIQNIYKAKSSEKKGESLRDNLKVKLAGIKAIAHAPYWRPILDHMVDLENLLSRREKSDFEPLTRAEINIINSLNSSLRDSFNQRINNMPVNKVSSKNNKAIFKAIQQFDSDKNDCGTQSVPNGVQSTGVGSQR